MNHEELYQELNNLLKEQVNSIEDDAYFSIETSKAIELQILPKLTEELVEIFQLKTIYFQKLEVAYFENIYRTEVLDYTVNELFKQPTNKLLWDENFDLAFQMYLSNFFLWINYGIVMIINKPLESSRYMNQLIARLLTFHLADSALVNILTIIISHLEQYHNNNGHLIKLRLDLSSICETYSKLVEKSQVENNSKKVSLPYQIALLKQLGFFDLEYFKDLSQTKVNMIIAKLLNTQDRSVSGNISALKDRNIGHHKYTSYKHVETVIAYLKALKNTN